MGFWDWVGRTAGSAIAEPVKAIGNAADELLSSDHELSQEETRRLVERIKVSLAELAIEEARARHPSWWVAGARPSLMWAATIVVMYATVGQHLVQSLGWAFGGPIPDPISWQEILASLGAISPQATSYVFARRDEKRDGVSR
ncbi:MAG: hypothetical protein IPM60_08215 [Rhodospirillales bacterium]|nr:hypothetical protein [Rhodospirillales bacterium]